MKDHLRNLLINFRSGLRLARCARVDARDFRASPDQILMLALVDLMLHAGAGYLGNLPDPAFNLYAVPAYGLYFTLLLLAAYLVGRIGSGDRDLLMLPTAILSLAPVFYLFWYPVFWAVGKVLDGDSSTPMAIFAGYFLWILLVMLRAIGLTHPRTIFRHGIALLAAIATWFVPVWYFGGHSEFWYASDAGDAADSSYAAYQALDAESIFYAQPILLEESTSPLKTHREGLVDLYFVGFAGYARQDVFLKETRYAQELFDRNFDATGRSLILANHLSTYESIPLANGHNLATSLKTIGARMNPDEDILVLYMTSHGSRKTGLSVDFWPLDLNDISPGMLKRHLDEAGIKWRVLMISSCYSGSFIDTLKDPYTVIATASAADRKSFGCGDHNDFTYFGEAVLKNQLSHRHTFVKALQDAAEEISRREAAEGINEPSNPQTFVGEAIAPRLKLLEERLSVQARSDIESRL